MNKSEANHSKCDDWNQKSFSLILETSKHRKYDKAMHGIIPAPKICMDQKKIRCLMSTYNLTCPVIKQNLYRQILRDMKANAIAENLVNSKFEDHGSRVILLTDMTT